MDAALPRGGSRPVGGRAGARGRDVWVQPPRRARREERPGAGTSR